MATKVKVTKAGKQDNAEANRLARLLRTQKKQPNNAQIDAALKTTRMHRKTPQNPVWSASWRNTAKLFKLFTGRFDMALMSSNREAAFAANAKPGKYAKFKMKDMPQRPFSLGARAHNQFGTTVWE